MDALFSEDVLVFKTRIQVRSATLRHLSSHTHFFEYDGWLPKA
jgi:hypothetical protein